jgi:hypothetical protein
MGSWTGPTLIGGDFNLGLLEIRLMVLSITDGLIASIVGLVNGLYWRLTLVIKDLLGLTVKSIPFLQK